MSEADIVIFLAMSLFFVSSVGYPVLISIFNYLKKLKRKVFTCLKI